MSRPPISAVIPTWSGLRYLPACLAALRAQLAPGDEIVLVDNASRDHAGDWARRHAPDVRVLTMPSNLGFAGGTAAGIAAARGELLLLINDDALAEPGCVAALWAALSESPGAGAAAGVLTFSRRPATVASAGIRFQRDGIATDLHLGLPVDHLPAAPVEIFGASGGLALLRRALLDDVGSFEPGFFSYLEDADLAWRARLRGWGTVLAPGARARHVYSATGGEGSPFKQRLLGRNRLRVIVRCLPGPILRDCLPRIVAYEILALGYATVRRQPAIARGRLEALGELPTLLAQRRAIQARRTAGVGELARWVEPAPARGVVAGETLVQTLVGRCLGPAGRDAFEEPVESAISARRFARPKGLADEPLVVGLILELVPVGFGRLQFVHVVIHRSLLLRRSRGALRCAPGLRAVVSVASPRPRVRKEAVTAGEHFSTAPAVHSLLRLKSLVRARRARYNQEKARSAYGVKGDGY